MFAPHRINGSFRRVVMGACATGTAWLLAAGALDYYGRTQRPHGTYDIIVVAGCRVLPDGNPSPALESRVRLAARLWHERPATQIILTGGLGTYPPSEAAAAAQVAESAGVPRAALLLESRSTSTAENARFARELTNAERVLLVTDSYHVYRARFVFNQYFKTVDAAGSLAPLGPRTIGAIREVAALMVYRVRALFNRAPT